MNEWEQKWKNNSGWRLEGIVHSRTFKRARTDWETSQEEQDSFKVNWDQLASIRLANKQSTELEQVS